MTVISMPQKTASPPACKICILGGMDGVESAPSTGSRGRICAGSRCEMFLFFISLFVLSPACFLTSTVTMSSTIMECDQGNWSLWNKCFFYNKTAPFPSSIENCKDFVSAPAFLLMSRLALVLICLLRGGEIVSLFCTCVHRSLTTQGVKVLVEMTIGMFIIAALWMFERSYPFFLNDELTGCRITENYWVLLWPFICIPCHYLVVLGWTGFFLVQSYKTYNEFDECAECNLFIEAIENHGLDSTVTIPHIICSNSFTDAV